MNIRILFLTIIFLSSNKLLSQSFENDLELKNNILSYPFNENNGFLNKDQSKLFFNSSNNPNNTLGINDMNDIWFRNHCVPRLVDGLINNSILPNLEDFI